jgi:hypothetical protein
MTPDPEQQEDTVERYTRGADDYWSGKVPEDWDGPDQYKDPYLAGWNHAAEQENRIGWFGDRHE